MPRQVIDNPVMGGPVPEIQGSAGVLTGSVNTITDGTITSNMKVFVVPTNGAAGLLMRTKSCYVDSIANGSFVFNVSATGAGAPSGDETFTYFAIL